MKFFYGKVYDEKLYPKLKLRCFFEGNDLWITATSIIKNEGSRRIRFKHRKCHIALYAIRPDGKPQGQGGAGFINPTEYFVSAVQIFKGTELLEAGETLEDSQVMVVRGYNFDCYRAEIRVSEEDGFHDRFTRIFGWRSGNSWATDDYAFTKHTEKENEANGTG